MSKREALQSVKTESEHVKRSLLAMISKDLLRGGTVLDKRSCDWRCQGFVCRVQSHLVVEMADVLHVVRFFFNKDGESVSEYGETVANILRVGLTSQNHRAVVCTFVDVTNGVFYNSYADAVLADQQLITQVGRVREIWNDIRRAG